MTNLQNLVIVPLNAAHNRAGFHCNVDALDHYIHKQAGQDIRRRISRIFVAVLPDNPKEVMGYYTLSSLSIRLEQLPPKLARKLPKHPVPAAHDQFEQRNLRLYHILEKKLLQGLQIHQT